MKKPIIGIVAKHFDGEERPSMYTSVEIKDAVIDNGGIPITIIPTDKGVHNVKINPDYKMSEKDRDLLFEQIKLCDGIILQGGNANFWYEPIIARYCIDNDIPLFGICAGQGNINRAFGGTLKPSNAEKHYIGFDYVHDMTIVPNTKLHQIIGKDKMRVNSIHKNHIDALANELTPSAFDDDGFPEVIEIASKRFCIGVKFHPECLYHKDSDHNNLFKAFISACAGWKVPPMI